MNRVTANTYFNTILILLLIAVSGSAAFFTYQIGYLVFFPTLVFLFRGMRIPNKHILFLIFTGLLIFAQTLYHTGNLNLFSSLLQISNILTIYLISRLVVTEFSFIYRRIMIVIALISLFFWTGLQISDAIKDELLYFAKDLAQLSSDEKLETIRPDTYYHLYLFVIPIGETLRNSGLFYEPGRFAVFLGIALALNLFRRKSKLFDIEDLIYIFAIVTTFSTAGYYALLILISTRVFLTYKSPLHLLIGIIAVPVLIWYVNGLDFMWEKVNSDYSNFESYSRFSAIAYHLELIAQSPILGWGYNIEDIELSPNGLTILVLRWGFVFSILYFVLLYKGVNTLLGSFRDQKWTRNLVFVTIIILTFSQTATVDAFYFALMFFGLSKFKLNASNG